jgi:hypothetical protein
MKDHRNPFLLQASEHIEADLTFVRLFGPGTLDLLKAEHSITTKIFFSAPGGGKTSLLRLFTPGPLLELHRHRDVADCKELFEKMKGLKVVDDDGPRVLGISLSCDRGYVNLGDIGLDAVKQSRLLFALLDARILLAAIRHALALKRVRPEEDQCGRLQFKRPASRLDLPGLELPCTGEELRVWARKREEEICATLDSFSPEDTTAAGSEGLQALDLLKPENVLFDGQPIAEQVLIMLDDVQRLTEMQRQRLIQFVLDKRSSTPIWIAERMEALNRDEILDQGTIHGRDYEPVFLENYWRGAQKRFENVVINIADRRVRDSRSIEQSHFEACLEDSMDGAEWRGKFEEIIGIVRARVLQRAANTSLFNNWVREREGLAGSARQRAIAWRSLEILIERELRKSQGSFGFELETDALAEKSDASLNAAAELFIANEFKLPYYYGASTLAKLSSFNIQQFLQLAAELFEETVSAHVIGQASALTVVRQENILNRASKKWWNQITERAAHPTRVRRLLESIGIFARSYTDRPTAPNDPGVNAIAISMTDRDRLLDPEWLKVRPEHKILAEVIASALAHNYLDAQPNYKCKGQLWLVLNLNRLLCVRYRLPLNYGLFKEQRLDELVKWMDKGFEPKRAPEEELL